MAPKIVDKEVRKKEILFAALQIFSKNGVVKSKMEDIAKVANIGKGTLYEYYKSKDDIFSNLFNLIFSDVFDKIVQATKELSNPKEKLKKIFSLSISELVNTPGNYGEIMLDIWAEGIREKNLKDRSILNIERFYEKYRTIIIEILEDGVEKNFFKPINCELTAITLIGAMDGIFLQWMIQKNLFDIATIENEFFELFFKGIEKGEEK